MNRVQSFFQREDIISSIDPRIAGCAAKKGTLYRLIPRTGTDPILLIKQTDGFGTDWIDTSEGANAERYVYFVGADQQYTTIQSAIDQGVIDGVDGTIGKKGIIVVYNGEYVEDLDLKPGFIIQAFGQTSDDAAVVTGHHTYTAPSTGDPSINRITFVSLSFRSDTPGDMFTFNGSNTAQGILHFYQCGLVQFASTGTMIIHAGNSSALISLLEECIIQGGSSNPEFDIPCGLIYIFNARVFFSLNTFLRLSGSANGSINYMDCNGANASDVIIVEIGASLFIAHSNIVNSQTDQNCFNVDGSCVAVSNYINQPGGAGFAFAGNGTLTCGGNTYGGNSTKQGTLTVNALVTD